MKKIYLFMVMALAVSFFSACSDDEDTIPSHADYNKFAPADADQSVEAKIRRDFKEQTNSYLIFNDTLSKEKTGEDMYGNPVYKVETLDINFALVGSGNSYIYTYDYIKDDAEKQKAANFVATHLARKLGGMMPFSILLVDRINCWEKDSYGNLVPAEDDYDGIVPHPLYVLGSRCLAVSVENGDAFDQEDYFESMLEDLVYKKLTADAYYLKDFFGAVENYDKVSYEYKDDLGYELGRNDDLARSLGFAKDYGYYKFCKDKEWDTRQFLNYLLTESESEIETEFAAYPICLKRFAIMRAQMEALGFKF